MAGGNQFVRGIGRGERDANEVKMADLLNDMQASKTKHHVSLIRMFSQQDSKEYQNVEKSLGNVVMDISVKFTDDVTANEKMVTDVIRDYYKLLAACEKYINKRGGSSSKGAARKDKVAEIQRYAQRDIVGVEQAFHAMKNMDARQQSALTWDAILHSARLDTIEVEDYYQLSTFGNNAKKDDNAGRRMQEGLFAPNENIVFGGASPVDLVTNAWSDIEANNALKKKNVRTNLANRNVATSRIANLLGLGMIVEQSKSVKVKDKKGNEKVGSLMTMAKGAEAEKTLKHEVQSKTVQTDDIEERERIAKGKISPTLQKELSSLQVLDYICGQGDRNRQNYFIEKEVVDNEEDERYSHVHAIDNDCSFGTGVDGEKIIKNSQNKGNFIGSSFKRMVVDSKDNLTIPHMDKKLAENIIGTKADEIRFVLKDLLEEPFIEATVQRFKKVQNGVKKELSKKESNVFVDENHWNENTLENFLDSGYRRKVMKRVAGNKVFASNMDSRDQLSLEERYELSRTDSYISVLVGDMMKFNELHNNYGGMAGYLQDLLKKEDVEDLAEYTGKTPEEIVELCHKYKVSKSYITHRGDKKS